MTARSLADATVAVVGVGLMGGSLAAALSGRCARRIGSWMPGHGPDDGGLGWIGSGLVDEAGMVDDVIDQADIVVLAMPTLAIAGAVPRVSALMQEGALLTDVGSSKRVVVAAMDASGAAVSCVGGHPMCGRETPGVENAAAGLYEGAGWALCPTGSTTAQAWQLACDLVRATGAREVRVDAAAHDRMVALTSHVPYVMAQALVHALAGRSSGEDELLAGGGLRDATRLAGGDVGMWNDIITANGDELMRGLDELASQLDLLRTMLEPGAQQRRIGWLVDGQRCALSLQARHP